MEFDARNHAIAASAQESIIVPDNPQNDFNVSNIQLSQQQQNQSEEGQHSERANIEEQSSNEEYSVQVRVAEDRLRRRSEIVSMRDYSSFTYSICFLISGLILTIGGIVPSIFPTSEPTNVILYEHKQLYDDWTSQPFVDIVLEYKTVGCPDGYEHIFHRPWNGTHDVCVE